MGSLVTYRRDDHAVRLGMDDGKLNVLSTPMLAQLHEAFERASGEGVPVVLEGRDGVMSAGFDLKVLRGGGAEAAELLQAGFTLAQRMLSFPTPVVVACTGHAIAMGLFVVLSGDYRIGAFGPFRLTANEVAIGMTLPRTPVEVCRYRLVPSYFDRVVILAEVFSPDAAVPAGILDRVVPPAEMESAVDEVLGALATLDMEAHRSTKLRAREGLLGAIDLALSADDAEYRASIGAPGDLKVVVGRVKERTAELRDVVVQVAVATLEADGVTGFTTRRLASGAGTSIPAVYELFGDKAGLVREVFFEGFRMLRERLERLSETGRSRDDLVRVIGALRAFVREHPVLAQVMFSRPFADFNPGPEEAEAGRWVRTFIVSRVRRCIDAGVIVGNETDVAHVLLALAQGLAAQEAAGWLGTTRASVDRRWALALRTILDGLSPRQVTGAEPAPRLSRRT